MSPVLDTVTYWEDVGYAVCTVISVHNPCTISRRALDEITPVSMALWTLPEKLLSWGMSKVRCQSDEVEEEDMGVNSTDGDDSTVTLQSYKEEDNRPKYEKNVIDFHYTRT